VKTAVIDVAATITNVTLYEDRAEAVRAAEVTLPAGSALVVVKDLPALVSDEHVVARLEPLAGAGASHVNDARVERIIHAGDDESGRTDTRVVEELRRIDDELQAARETLARKNAERHQAEAALQRWTEALTRAAGRGEGNPSSWASGADAFTSRIAALDAERAKARETVSTLERRRGRLQLEATAGRPKKVIGQRTVAELRLRVSGPGGRYRLVVSTLTPCAAWRPTHEAHLVDAAAPNESPRVRFITMAAVWNNTGEAWNDVELVLSTARPSAGAELPPLRADRLTLRQKTAEERKTIVVQHREESVPRTSTQGTAPGVDDGGEARVFRAEKVTVKDDGRPHRVQLATFDAACALSRVAFPEVAQQVFLRASLKNNFSGPILAGPVTLVANGAWVGTGDVLFVGAGESFDLSFGTDDRFLVRTKRRKAEDKKIVGKDVVHFIREAVLSQTGTTTEKVLVHLRLPVSEVKQLKVLPSPQHTTIADVSPDEHGIVKVPVELPPNVEKKLVLAFSFDTSGDVRIPDPW
jgi:uncharacterized protein (TIGR02231 family)